MIVTFVDFQKAFDMVDIPILLDKLYNIGVRGIALDWLNSYLINRRIMVKINKDTFSDLKVIQTGVPQSSILCPILFLIYINDIVNVVKHCKVILYADDILLISSHINFSVANSVMQEDFVNLMMWTHDNKLLINYNKSKVMHIVSKTSYKKGVEIRAHEHDCLHGGKTKCDCFILEQISNYNYLGIEINDICNFRMHIKKLHSKLRKIIYQLQHVRDFVTLPVLKLIYHTLAENLLRYGITVWGSVTILDIMCKNQDRMIKIMYDKLGKDINSVSINERYKELNVQPIKKLYSYIIIVDNFFNNKYKILKNYDRDFQLRDKNRYFEPRYFNEYGKKHFSALVPKIINSLPSSLREIDKIGILKKEIRKWLLK